MTPTTKADMAALVADETEVLIERLLAGGVPVDAVLAGVHAAIVTAITQAAGGTLAAECFRKAADRVEHLPALHASPLAAMPVQGRA